nr:putative integron gene cassette protein [uncultured bacterium]
MPLRKKESLRDSYQVSTHCSPDKSYELKSNGQVKEQTKYLRLPENIRFTFAVLSKYFKIDFSLGIGTSNWDKFLAAQEIRNRITHPKTSAEFSISDEEIAICRDVSSWFNDLIIDFFNGLIANSQRIAGDEA